jgi:hypothetical protein
MSNVEIIENMPFEKYVAIDRTNISSLCWLMDSPHNYSYQSVETDNDTNTLRVGRASHTATLEPQLYKDVAVWLGSKKDESGCTLKAFVAKHSADGVTALSAIQDDQARGVAAAVHAHPIASKLFDGGQKELTVLWTHERTGLQMKSRLDYLDAERRLLVDLKTAARIDPHGFGQDAAKFHYDIKMAFYVDAALQVIGPGELATSIVAVEPKAPHDVQCYDLGPADDDYLAKGREVYEALIDLLIKCRAENYWPGRGATDVLRLTRPAYVRRDVDLIRAMGDF